MKIMQTSNQNNSQNPNIQNSLNFGMIIIKKGKKIPNGSFPVGTILSEGLFPRHYKYREKKIGILIGKLNRIQKKTNRILCSNNEEMNKLLHNRSTFTITKANKPFANIQKAMKVAFEEFIKSQQIS